MKYFLILVISMWSLPVMANRAFVGVWEWSGFQCRNSNLEPDSARSTEWEPGGISPASAKITLESDNSASFTFTYQDANVEKKKRETGTWEVEDNTHVVIGDAKGGFTAWLIDGDLVIYGDHEGVRHDRESCSSGESFVWIFSRVDR